MARLLKIAVITTVWHPLSHADVIVSRWVRPFPTDGEYGWTQPSSSIVSAYIEQRPENDIGEIFCSKNGISVYQSIEDALTLGGTEINVDAVLLVAEHGDYPSNQYQQKLYPRKRFFDEIVAAFRKYGRVVPVFNDKHFSWSFEESAAMIATASELNMPFYGGSSLPHCAAIPEAPLIGGEEVTDVLALFAEHPEHYGYHIMEVAQAYLEKRKGGETGICAVRGLHGVQVREAMERGELPEDLFLEALQHDGYPLWEGLPEFLFDRTAEMYLFQLEYSDGVRATFVNIPKFTQGWVTAFRFANGTKKVCSVEGGGGARSFYCNFARLNAVVERFFQTKEVPNSLLRTHLVAGALEVGLQSLAEGGEWRKTPQLSICF